jgi:hypothetical protein
MLSDAERHIGMLESVLLCNEPDLLPKARITSQSRCAQHMKALGRAKDSLGNLPPRCLELIRGCSIQLERSVM